MVNISTGTALLAAVLGYAVVFLGIVFLMAVITISGKALKKKTQPAKEITAVDLGSVTVPAGVDPKKVAAVMAAIAEMEREA